MIDVYIMQLGSGSKMYMGIIGLHTTCTCTCTTCTFTYTHTQCTFVTYLFWTPLEVHEHVLLIHVG